MQQLEQSASYPEIKLKPLITYPREAQAGKEYLMTIDIELADPQADWPYPEEEYEILFQLDLHPYFSYQALSKHEPMIVLHRFGGTYGPAEFLLTTNTRKVAQGDIGITFLNTVGLPIAYIELPCEIKEEIQTEHLETVRIKQLIHAENITTISQGYLEEDKHHKALIQHLTQSNWTVIDLKYTNGNPRSKNELLDLVQIQQRRFPYTAMSGSPWLPNGYILDVNNTPLGLVIVREERATPGKIPTQALEPILNAFFNFEPGQPQMARSFLYEVIGEEIQFYNYLEPSMLKNGQTIDIKGHRVFTFHRPETLATWSEYTLFGSNIYQQNQNNLFHFHIKQMPPLKKGSLINFQFQAIQNIESSLINDQTHALAQMEIGSGQTHTAISSIFRWLSFGKAKYILYLVNSNKTEQYTIESIRNFIIDEETGSKFSNYYNVDTISGTQLSPNIHVYVTTIEKIYALFSASINLTSTAIITDLSTAITYNPNIPIEYFDAIVITKGEHLSYSKWKSFLEYFDAPIIGIAEEITEEVLDFFHHNLVYPSPKSKEEVYKQLSATIKSVRDLLRKDAGMAGDTDRLPQLTWLLFLKNLDDFELAQEDMYGDDYLPIIEEPYRWRDWVDTENSKDRRTGDELLDFVNNDLTNYLKQLGGESNRDIRTIVGTIFKGTYNRLRSGYILRDVVNKLNNINFNASDDIHAISLFYETMLKEMRDAAGDSGEFYTPRPVVRFIIDRLNPQIGESIMDPACGTAGFLVEAYTRMAEQVQTTEQQQLLFDSLIGIEKKPMSYLLAIMNLLLHGIETPDIRERNALAVNVNQIANADLVDIVATNPPFGGEEDDGIIKNFPAGMRTDETALLFFQYIMALLKRPNGRAGVVLPNGFLFRNGVATIIKEKLLKQFNLHTIVRLPAGTFAPYTGIPTNILFFEAVDDLYPRDNLYPSKALYPSTASTSTREIWYYEIPLPAGRKSYTKTKPLQDEDFQACLNWWKNRIENAYAWKVSIEEIIDNNYNLDFKNPRAHEKE